MERVLDFVRRWLKAKAAKLPESSIEYQQGIGGFLLIGLEQRADCYDRAEDVLGESGCLAGWRQSWQEFILVEYPASVNELLIDAN